MAALAAVADRSGNEIAAVKSGGEGGTRRRLLNPLTKALRHTDTTRGAPSRYCGVTEICLCLVDGADVVA